MDAGVKYFIIILISLLGIRTVLSSSDLPQERVIKNEKVISGMVSKWELDSYNSFKKADIALPWNIILADVPVKFDYELISDPASQNSAKNELNALLLNADSIKLIPSDTPRDTTGRIIGSLIIVERGVEIRVADVMEQKGYIKNHGRNSK
jgi:hypothetical protein